MDRLKLKTTCIEKLIINKFKRISNTELVCKFPVYKYKHSTLITCVLTADIEEQVVMVEIIDNSTGTIYSPYYNRKYGKNSVVDIIDKNINNEIKSLRMAGIIK